VNPTDLQSDDAPSPGEGRLDAGSTGAVWAWVPAVLHRILGRRQREEEQASGLPRLHETEPRDAALRGMLWSAPLAGLTIFAVYALAQDGRFEAGFKLFGQFSAVFLVPLFVHATQLVTNVQFWELSNRWDELAGWQRGVFGVIIVLLAGAVILSLAFSVGMHLAIIPSGE
jgi:hypothetical protein